MLSQDPNSLANLDQGSLPNHSTYLEKLINIVNQDLPNNLQAQVPIVSEACCKSDKC